MGRITRDLTVKIPESEYGEAAIFFDVQKSTNCIVRCGIISPEL